MGGTTPLKNPQLLHHLDIGTTSTYKVGQKVSFYWSVRAYFLAHPVVFLGAWE